MCKICLIANGSYIPGVNFIDDIVDVLEDNVEFSGNGAKSFKIINVKNVTKSEFEDILPIRFPGQEEKGKYEYTAKEIESKDIEKLEDTNVSKSEQLTILGKVELNINGAAIS
jgi:hypothetical protein